MIKKLFFAICALVFVSQVEAATRYVSTTGSNANSCAQATSTATPKLTIQAGVNCLVAGDTLEIRGGTYTENGDTSIAIFIPVISGTSASSPVTIQNFSGEQVIIRPNATMNDYILTTYGGASPTNYITINGENGGTAFGIQIDGINTFKPSGNCGSCGASGIVVYGTNWTIQGVEILNIPYTSLSGIRTTASNTTVRRVKIHDCRNSPTLPYNPLTADSCTGFYFDDPNLSLTASEFYGFGAGPALTPCPSNPADCSNWEISGNIIRNSVEGIRASRLGSNSKIHHNLIYNIDATPLGNPGYFGDAITIRVEDNNGVRVYNNTIYNVTASTASYGVTGYCINNSSSNSFFRNNILRLCGQGATTDSGAGNTFSNNTTADPLFIDAANGQFQLQSTSAAIDAGTGTIVSGSLTLTCNGAVGTCTQGAYDPPRVNSCSATGNTLSVIYTVNQFPPMANLDAPGGKSVTIDGSSRTISSPTLVGSNQVNYTFSGAAVSSSASHVDGGTGTLSDSALIGNQTANVHKVKSISTMTCTVTGAATTLTQSRFRFHGLRGTQAAPVVKAGENTNWTIQPGGSVRFRIKYNCTVGDCAAWGPQIRYSKNGGAYTAIPESYGADNIKLYGTTDLSSDIPAHLTQTTELLTSDHATNVTGAIIRTSATVPTLDLSQNSEVENEWVISINTGQALDTTYDFRVYKNDGTTLDTYSQTPRLTVKSAEFQGMQMSQVDIETDQPIRIVRRVKPLGYVEVRVNKGTTLSVNGVSQ